jgi:hypothetical protein
MMSQKAFELLLAIMRRAFSGQSLLAKDQNWIQRTDSTIQQGGWVLCLQGTSAASITAAVRKEYCSALLRCLPQHMTRSELGAKTLAYPSSFLCWHDVITTNIASLKSCLIFDYAAKQQSGPNTVRL